MNLNLYIAEKTGGPWTIIVILSQTTFSCLYNYYQNSKDKYQY